MGEIQEVFDDLKDGLGKKGFLIFIAVAVIFGLYNLFKGSGSSDGDLVPVTSVTSYPDAVTNANVIIDSIQNSIDYSEGVILENIQGLGSTIDTTLQENFQATNDYINAGLNSQEKLFNENMDEIHGILEGLTTNKGSSGSSSSGSSSSGSTTVTKPVEDIKNDLNNQTTTKPSTSTTTTTKPATSTASYYTYTTKSGLNTSTSIVDALKATGADSSFSNRAQIYYANGGTGTYTGSASQNVSMLNKLKAGTLKKV